MTASRAGLRRSWPQRLLITFNCLLIVLCLLGAGVLAYFYNRIGELPRATFAAGVLGEDDPGDPQNFLLVGSDTRAFAEGDEAATDSFGDSADVPGQRADTIMLIRVDPRSETAAMVSFPRDLWIEMPGEGRSGRINTAFEGGPEALVRTISEGYDIPIHHYLQVDFAGFKGLVDAVDGVEVFLPAPVRDRDANGNNISGLDIPTSGCVSLSGDQALAYVRSRHFEQLVDGRWSADPTGDLGRIARQQDFMRRAVNEALSKDLLNPARINQLMDVAIDNVTVDPNLDLRDMMNLGKRFRSLAPDALQQYTLPVEITRVGRASVLLLVDGQETQDVLNVFRGIPPGDPAAVAPAAVTLRVLNGTGVAGQAGAASDGLSAAGFGVAGVGNDSASNEVTTVRYGSGQAAKAALVARYLEPEVQLVEDTSLQVDVVVVTGATFAGIRSEPRPAEEVPVPVAPATTTAPPAPADDAEPPPVEC
jgi:LCP family protein required for cell wall assembly